MQPTHRTVAVAAAVAATVATSFALADELSAPLSKAEVTPLVVGKKVSYLRKRDGAQQAYDFKDDGSVYFTTSTTMRNTSVSGTYTIDDNGAICFKWNQDKYISMQDGCQLMRRDGAKIVLVGRRAPDVVFGEVQ